MSFIRFLMLDFGIFYFVSLSMACPCTAPLTPATMVIKLVFNPIIVSTSNSTYTFERWIEINST